MISAEVICDSISSEKKRLTTFVLRYPKFIHGEFMTHRVLSRNASSSRAVPVAKLLQEVREDALRAGPVFWGAEQKGMQASESLSLDARKDAENLWRDAAISAAHHAEALSRLGVHKNIANRILEPFSHINVVATATEWDNFFGLRLHKDAQPEMRALAEEMWRSFDQSWPETLQPGEWHLPFVDQSDWASHQIEQGDRGVEYNFEALRDDMIKVSVARCARVSYTSFETKKRSTVEEDIKLHDRLLAMQPKSLLPMPLHASPAEHQATPDVMTADERGGGSPSEALSDWPGGWACPRDHGNFVGWRQYRKMLPNEAVAPLPEGYARRTR